MNPDHLPIEAIRLAGAFMEGYFSTVSDEDAGRLSMLINSIVRRLKRGANFEEARRLAQDYGSKLASSFPVPIEKVIAALEAADLLLAFSSKPKEKSDV